MKTLYIGNIPFKASEQDVRDFFEAHGTVHSVKLIRCRQTGRPRGFGFVEMDSTSADKLLKLAGFELDGRPLRIDEARERLSRRASPPE